MIGIDIFCGSTGSTLNDVFNIAHPVGKGILSAFGAGGLADVVQPLEQQGIESTMSPEERAAAQAKRAQQAPQQAAAQRPGGAPGGGAGPASAPAAPGARPSAPQAPASAARAGLSGWAKAGIGAGIVAALLLIWRAFSTRRVVA